MSVDVHMGTPHLPACSSVSVGGLSLASIRDVMTRMPADEAVEQAITSVVTKWRADPGSIASSRSDRPELLSQVLG